MTSMPSRSTVAVWPAARSIAGSNPTVRPIVAHVLSGRNFIERRAMRPRLSEYPTTLRLLLIATLALVAGGQAALAQQPNLRARFNLPAAGETRFVPNEIILESLQTVP